MPGCCIKGCRNNNRKTESTGIRYFSFPKESYWCQKWIDACKQNSLNLKYARVCSLHFNEGSYDESYLLKLQYGYPLTKTRVLRHDAVPTEFLLLPTTPISPVSRKRKASKLEYGSRKNEPHVGSFNVNKLTGVQTPSPEKIKTSRTMESLLKTDSVEIKLEFEDAETEITEMRQLRPCVAFPLDDHCEEIKGEEPFESNENELTRLQVTAGDNYDNCRGMTGKNKFELWDSSQSTSTAIKIDDIKEEVEEIIEARPITSISDDSCQRMETDDETIPKQNGLPDSHQLILNLIEYFRAEEANGGPLVPLSAVYQRVAHALKINESIVEERAKHRNPSTR